MSNPERVFNPRQTILANIFFFLLKFLLSVFLSFQPFFLFRFLTVKEWSSVQPRMSLNDDKQFQVWIIQYPTQTV